MYPLVAPTPWTHKAGDNNQRYHYNRRSNCHVQHLGPFTESRHLQQTVRLNVMQPVVFVFVFVNLMVIGPCIILLVE